MKNNFKTLIILLMMAFLMFTLVGCPTVADEENTDDTGYYKETKSLTHYTNLDGYWKSSYGDGFEIDGTNFYQYDDASKTVSFAGTIVDNIGVKTSEGQSGYSYYYIINQITNGGTWYKTVGNYYTISYKSFVTNLSVKESSAYKSGGESDMSTQDGADKEFTVPKGYFSYYGDYSKQ